MTLPVDPAKQQHTFGRLHTVPPPLPQSVQQGVGQDGAVLMSGNAAACAHNVQSQDLDHLVRSIGEW